MTNLEHFMLYSCFGMVLGWFLCDLGFIIFNITKSVKKKIKAHRKKKHLESNKQTNK